MNPIVVPASTGMAFGAACLTTLIIWALRTWAHVEMSVMEAQALTGVLTVAAGHFTTDKPSKPAVEAALVVAEKKEDAVAAAVAKDAPK